MSSALSLSLSGLVAFSHLQVSQIRGRQPLPICAKDSVRDQFIAYASAPEVNNRRVIYELVLAIAPEINYSVGCI